MIYHIVIEQFFLSYFEEAHCFVSCYFDIYSLVSSVELECGGDDLF